MNYYELDKICDSLDLTYDQRNAIYAFADKINFGEKSVITEMILKEDCKQNLFRELKKDIATYHKFITMLRQSMHENAAAKLKQL